MTQSLRSVGVVIFLLTGSLGEGSSISVPQPANSIEMPYLRNQFSRTFKTDDYHYVTQIFPLLVDKHSNFGEQATIMSDSTKRAYPDNLDYWTGTVGKKSNQYSKSSGGIKIKEYPGNSSSWWYQGWFKFNLSTIPDSSTIDTVSINFYCYTSNNPSACIRLLSGDPVNTEAPTLWNLITTGTQVTVLTTVPANTWLTWGLNSSGKQEVQSKLQDDWVALGLHADGQQGDSALIYGIGSGQYTPYLEISYTLPLRTDISMEEILEPAGNIPANTVIVPTGRWRNRQPHPDDYTAWFIFINPAGQRTTLPGKFVQGHRGLSDTVLFFTPFALEDTGLWTVKCSTYAQGDIDPSNDVLVRFFRVSPSGSSNNFDVAAKEIISPRGTFDTNATVTPQACWENVSSNPATFFAYFALNNPNNIRVYTNSVVISELAPGKDTVISFTPYSLGTTEGRWTASCSTVAVGDTYPENDWIMSEFCVVQGGQEVNGWHEVASMPFAPSGRAIKDGGWLTFDRGTGLFFAAKGNKTGDFYIYDPQVDTWHERSLWKAGNEGKGAGKGAVGVADGQGRVYAVKGNNTLGFWCYHMDGDSWQQLPDVPIGPSNKKVKGGSDLVYVEQGEGSYVYFLKGYKNEFYRYNVLSDSWEQLPEAPQAFHPKWDKGSWLCYDDDHYIYAHKAKYHELWRFDIYTVAWDTHRLKGMPYLSVTGKNKKAKEGSSATYMNGRIYALKGGNTCEFYEYFIVGDSWTELSPIPEVGSTGRKKRVKAGGDIAFSNSGALFALKGNKTRELWCYTAPTKSTAYRQNSSLTSLRSFSNSICQIAPNPCKNGSVSVYFTESSSHPVAIRVLDITGAVRIQHTVVASTERYEQLNLRNLPAGIYWVQLRIANRIESEKLILSR